ncbi:hypothetical protein LTR02_000356 [Friedmanniomyces endolithicus]|nr:hypothetical protein LTR94_010463 [Friedmanniomyces endolithicus]KAK0792550.1 hypothetical protein LTR75_011430 [Friedmanniomyces endolithicus]KAK0793964.1 hypothetical protein LTR38_009373 [Friedmanniomyces endolithicus]KAK0806248.1 hypothetical protein LTR59_003661 [Friedmanniomyces endolithicus]KAK0841961.1 hypothetical protein LTR03_009593 [Friedmanniomyces endolithicus]
MKALLAQNNHIMAESRELGAGSTDSNIYRAQPQSGCRLLSLAPELRNSIYELVFDESSDSPVDLRKTKPPSKALLLTCRAIHAEACLIYKHVYRQYWSTNHFELNFPGLGSDRAARQSIKKLTERDCDHMAYVKIVETSKVGSTEEHTYLRNGMWKAVGMEHGSIACGPSYEYLQDCRERVEGVQLPEISIRYLGEKSWALRGYREDDLDVLTSRVSTMNSASIKAMLLLLV